jgi:hypothetical protein
MNRTRKIPRKSLAILFLLACTVSLVVVQAAFADTLRLIYTNDNIGELDSCG